MESKKFTEFIPKPQFIDSFLIEEMKRYLSERCSDYAEAEKKYLRRVREFESTEDNAESLINGIIMQHENTIAACMLFAGYRGFEANIDNFQKSKRSFSQFYEPEQYLNERVMKSMPIPVQTTLELRNAYETMTEEQKELYEDIANYFILLEDHGTKLSHFYGYMLANHLLYKIIPGYVEDQFQTHSYTKKLSTYLGFDVLRISTRDGKFSHEK